MSFEAWATVEILVANLRKLHGSLIHDWVIQRRSSFFEATLYVCKAKLQWATHWYIMARGMAISFRHSQCRYVVHRDDTKCDFCRLTCSPPVSPRCDRVSGREKPSTIVRRPQRQTFHVSIDVVKRDRQTAAAGRDHSVEVSRRRPLWTSCDIGSTMPELHAGISSWDVRIDWNWIDWSLTANYVR